MTPSARVADARPRPAGGSRRRAAAARPPTPARRPAAARRASAGPTATAPAPSTRPRNESITRQHVVASGLGPPQLDQRAQALGMLGADVVRLGEVVRRGRTAPSGPASKSWLPGTQLALDAELRADVVGRRLPAVVVDRAAAEHLEVLRAARRRRRRRRRTTGSSDAPSIGCCATPSTTSGAVDAGGVEDRRHDVDGVAELRAHLAARGDAGAASARSAACARRRARCSASTAAAACCPPRPSPRRSGCRRGSRRARRRAPACRRARRPGRG